MVSTSYPWLWVLLAGLIVLGAMPSRVDGQQKAAAPGDDELVRGVEDWLRENFDDDLLDALGEVDHQRVVAGFESLLKKLDATDIFDLASAREAAVRLLPLLQQFEETQPYVAWLETRIELLDAAEALRRESGPVSPKPALPQPVPQPRPQPPTQAPRSTPPRSGPGTATPTAPPVANASPPTLTAPPLLPPPAEAHRRFWEKRLERRPVPGSGEVLVPKLKALFRGAGLPAELVWLAEIESSFNPRAKSPKGAAGLFQLMPATARSLGLSATWPFDDRLDPEENARAAARYLRYLHGRFRDWRLVLAAYNAGEGRVGDLLKGAKARSFEAIAGRLPAETQLYVPRFEATLRRREGVSITQLGPPK